MAGHREAAGWPRRKRHRTPDTELGTSCTKTEHQSSVREGQEGRRRARRATATEWPRRGVQHSIGLPTCGHHRAPVTCIFSDSAAVLNAMSHLNRVSTPSTTRCSPTTRSVVRYRGVRYNDNAPSRTMAPPANAACSPRAIRTTRETKSADLFQAAADQERAVADRKRGVAHQRSGLGSSIRRVISSGASGPKTSAASFS